MTDSESRARGKLWKRHSFAELTAPGFIAKCIKEYDWIGEDTPQQLHGFLVNLAEFFWDADDKLPTQNLNGLNIRDLGVHDWEPTNPSGGSFLGCYRIFSVEERHGEPEVGIAVLALEKTVNLPKYGNRKGGTILAVAVRGAGKPHNSLQLRLDNKDFVSVSDNRYTIRHNGIMARKRRLDVTAYVRERASGLVDSHSYVILGTLDNSQNITWQQEGVRQFVANLIRYALLRDEYKNQ